MILKDHCEKFNNRGLELVVDLSNICRNTKLDSTGDIARWDRVIRVMEKWNIWSSGLERPVTLFVADSNLRYKFARDDLQLFKDALRDGFVIENDKADPLILDYAESHNCMVLSNDQFLSYRRGRPWMTGDTTHFVSLEMQDKDIVLNVCTLEEHTDFSKSRAEEKDALKNNHIGSINSAESSVLKSLYKCVNQKCLRRAFLPDDAPSMPAIDRRGDTVCPGCGNALEVVGPINGTVIIRISKIGSASEPLRVPIGKDQSVTMGRSGQDVALTQILNDVELQRISRDHLAIVFDGSKVLIADRGSTNGSNFHTWDNKNSKLGPPIKMGVGERFVLRPRDEVTLAGIINVKRSGRRFPFDLKPLADRSKPTNNEIRTKFSSDGI